MGGERIINGKCIGQSGGMEVGWNVNKKDKVGHTCCVTAETKDPSTPIALACDSARLTNVGNADNTELEPLTQVASRGLGQCKGGRDLGVLHEDVHGMRQ